MRSFENKNVFLTGAASGIGRALTMQLAKLGCRLYLVDVDEVGLQDVAREVSENGNRVLTRVCDLAKPDQVAATLADFDQRCDVIDLLINNAGVALGGLFWLMQRWTTWRLLSGLAGQPLAASVDGLVVGLEGEANGVHLKARLSFG